MNAQYQKKQQINSNIDMIGSFLDSGKSGAAFLEKRVDGVLSLLAAILTFLTDTRVLAIVRVLTVAVCLVAFVGLIGAMECGALSLGFGVLLGALFFGIEVLVLRFCRH